MDIDQDRIDSLAAAPSEGLNVEIKRWINPDEADGISKIVRATFAIRNRNGGFLLIGFDDKTLHPVGNDQLLDVHGSFHGDKIQRIISNYASDVFEVAVGFARRDGTEYPVIAIPEGVRTPVAARRDLKNDSGRFLIREGDVYFRTLTSNGTPSTARARPNDWQAIAEICFENRDADIGRFLRRHLTGEAADKFVETLVALHPSAAAPVLTLRDRAVALLDAGEERFRKELAARSPEEIARVKGLGTWGVALAIHPPHLDVIPDGDFLNTVSAANPQYTGWPAWLDSRGADRDGAPKIIDKAWQAMIFSFPDGWAHHVDLIRFDPKGEFYFLRVLQDDLTPKITPRTELEVILVVIRVAEATAVGLRT